MQSGRTTSLFLILLCVVHLPVFPLGLVRYYRHRTDYLRLS